MKLIAMRALSLLGLSALGAVSTGCAADASGSVPDDVETVGTSSEALNACPANDICQTTVSNNVTTRVYLCPWSASLSAPSAQCAVDSDFVLVGGGAEIEGEGSPGALLTASAPFDDTHWIASSTQHLHTYPHRVRAYAIGLRLVGLTPAQLKTQVHLNDAVSAQGAHPSVTSLIPSNDMILSVGGQTVSSTGAGQLLTAIAPNVSNGFAASKDHEVADPGFAVSWVYSIAKCPAGLSYCLQSTILSKQSGTGTGYELAIIPKAAGGAITGVGALSIGQPDGPGRLLTASYPIMGGGSTIGSVAISKDHDIFDSGYVLTYTIGLTSL